MAGSNNSTPSARGREAVEAKLIDSTCTLLASTGPNALSIRDIASHAGVNHGQIHHYFGGKQGLITAAIKKLAREHEEHAREGGLDEFEGPKHLTLGRDQNYVQAVIRSILDDQLDLAILDIEDNTSVPRHIMKAITKLLGHRKPTTEIKGFMASQMAIELAWAVFEPYIMAQIDAKPAEVAKIRQYVIDQMEEQRDLLAKKAKK
ncbi:TetR/AcrR family transcriptional regulator [Maricurvus nonylphenolicus]|uniref:TetR/AcrR family transcriptional regulator n=1 Tax=Maricurvus nonylphenolicus TaxID=1008307 RepID=UPI0036F42D55